MGARDSRGNVTLHSGGDEGILFPIKFCVKAALVAYSIWISSFAVAQSDSSPIFALWN
jgi:hypothetical protein